MIYKNPTQLGSSPKCEIYLFKDPEVSPRHAAIHKVAGGHEIEDLGSASGTLVNGKPVTRTRLRGGDEIRIGETTLKFIALCDENFTWASQGDDAADA